MARARGRSIAAALRGAADHHRLRAAAGAVHVSVAGRVPAPFIYTTFLSTLPPLILLATGLTFVIGGGRDRPLLSLDHRLFRLRLRGAVQGIRARLARRDRGPRLGRARRLRQWRDHRQGRHSLVHDDARHPVLLGRHGDGAVGRQVLRAARRRGELGLAMDRRPPVRLHPTSMAAASLDPGACGRRSSSASSG